MKKLAIIFVFLILIFNSINIFADDSIKVLVNNKPLVSDNKPVKIDGVILVPIRPIAESMECEVVWIAGTQTANIRNANTIISMQIGNPYVSVVKRNNQDERKLITLDVSPQFIDNVVYVPIRALGESFGAVVGWDSYTNSVLIVYDTTLKYSTNMTVSTYAGTGELMKHDSTLDKMSFTSPESIDIAEDGTIYVSDAGIIRKIKDGKSESVEFEPQYITADAIRCYKNDVYILTNEFQDENNVKYYGIVKLTGGGAEGIFVTEAVYSKITDFDFSEDGKMYILQNNVGVGKNYVGILNLSTSEIEIIAEVDNGITSLAIDKKNNVYLGNSVKGSIYYLDINSKEVKLFAGVDDRTKFVDGPNPFFFEPRRLRYKDNTLYVLDYNIVRKIVINEADLPIYSETLAGKVNLESNPQTQNGKASETAFASSYLMDFVIMDDTILMTDTKKGVIRQIK